jgi:hypothetical protein
MSTRSLTLIRPALVLLAMLGVASSLAQQPSSPLSEMVKELHATIPGNSTIISQIRFEGGLVTDYVDTLRKATPGPLNIVLDTTAAKLVMPAVGLSNVTLRNALMIIPSLATSDDQGRETTVRVEFVDQQESPFIGIVRGFVAPHSDEARSLTTFTDNLTGIEKLRDGLTLDDVLALVRLTAEQVSTSPARVVYHSETGLLVFAGTSRQVEAVGNALASLRARARTAPQAQVMTSFELESGQEALALSAVRAAFANELATGEIAWIDNSETVLTLRCTSAQAEGVRAVMRYAVLDRQRQVDTARAEAEARLVLLTDEIAVLRKSQEADRQRIISLISEYEAELARCEAKQPTP